MNFTFSCGRKNTYHVFGYHNGMIKVFVPRAIKWIQINLNKWDQTKKLHLQKKKLNELDYNQVNNVVNMLDNSNNIIYNIQK